jgi:epoxyqueuosine reductase
MKGSDTVTSLRDTLITKAKQLGFDLVGIAPAEKLDDAGEKLATWLSRGHHATMFWMERNRHKRTDPREIVAGARSIISVGLNYYAPYEIGHDPDAGKISRYAWGDDYHDIVGERLAALVSFIDEMRPGSESRSYVDTGPVMEKVWAERAGLGWIGKHTNLISREFGSWIFLGEIITTLELEYDIPTGDYCGTCRRCIDACPTDAIVDEYILDSNRCLSYLTIEHRGEFPEELKPNTEQWIFGCDICQDVCPWNKKFSQPSAVEGFLPRPENLQPLLVDIVSMAREDFTKRYNRSPVKRAKLQGLRRNARAVLEGTKKKE